MAKRTEEDKDRYERAKRRFAHPGVQRRLMRIREHDWEETTLPASLVFAERLRETREARGFGLRDLADLMTHSGAPISKSRLSRIERGEIGVSLDEALALTYALQAVLSNMLIPPSDKLVRLGGGFATDGASARRWMASGLPARSRQKPAPEIERDVRLEEAGRRAVRHAR